MLSRGDQAARARLGAVARGGDGEARRGAPAAATRRDGGGDHGHGRRLEAGVRDGGAGRSGLVDWAREYLNERVVGRPARRQTLRAAASTTRHSRARARVPRACGRHSSSSWLRRPSSTSAAPRGCSARCAARSSRPASACSSCSSGGRRCSRSSPTRSTRAAGRSRRAGGRGRGAPRRRVRRRALRTRQPLARRGRPAGAVADGLRDGDPLRARGGVRAFAARRGRLRGRLRLMATAERDYYELLGVARDASDDEIKRAFRRLARELHPDVSDDPTRRTRFRAGRRGLRGALRPERRAAVRPLRPRGSPGRRLRRRCPTSATSPTSSRRSSARASSARRARPRRGPCAGRDVAAQVEIDLAEASRGTTLDGRRRVARDVRALRRHRRRAGHGLPRHVPGLRRRRTCPAGVAERVRQMVRSRTCPRCDGAGTIVETPCEHCGGDGRHVEDVPLEVEIPAGIHDGQRIRVRGAGHAARRGGPVG